MSAPNPKHGYWFPAAALGAAVMAGGLGVGFIVLDPADTLFFPGAGAAFAALGVCGGLILGLLARRLLAQTQTGEAGNDVDR